MKNTIFMFLTIYCYALFSCNKQAEKKFDTIAIEQEVKEMFRKSVV